MADLTPKYYNYIYVNPLTNRVFYVGKGTKNRCYQHLKNVENGKYPKRYNNRFYGFIKKLIDNNIKPIIIITSWFFSENEAFENEKRMIKHYRKNESGLLNLTGGGDGFDSEFSSQRSKKMWANEGKKKQLIEAITIGLNKPEAKERLSKARENWVKNNPESYEETRRKIVEKQQTDEYRQNSSKNAKERWANPEYKMRLKKKAKEGFAENPNRLVKLQEGLIAYMEDESNYRNLCEERKARWDNENYKNSQREKISKANKNNPKLIEFGRERWKDESYRKKMSEMAKANWQNPEYVTKVLTARRKKVA